MANAALRSGLLWLIAAILIGEAALARSQDDCVNDLAGKDPTVDELITGLTVAPCRGLQQVKLSTDQIRFGLNSAQISPEAKGFLDRLGQALSSEKLSAKAFIVEGHTDTAGPLQYNMSLSKRRAESVKRYLMSSYNISAGRLRAEGKGPTDLLDKENPESAANRRVVIVVVKPGN